MERFGVCAGQGFLGVPVPRALGGLGLDTLSYILAVEELAKHDASHAITVSAHTTLGTSPILAFGTPTQRERWVPLLATGRALGGFGLTEPGAPPAGRMRGGPGPGPSAWRVATGSPAPRSSSPTPGWVRSSR